MSDISLKESALMTFLCLNMLAACLYALAKPHLDDYRMGVVSVMDVRMNEAGAHGARGLERAMP